MLVAKSRLVVPKLICRAAIGSVSVRVLMKIFAFVSLAALVPFVSASATPADDEFQKLAGDYIESGLRMHPEGATELGDHRFDGQLTDYSAEARARELADHKALLEKLNAFKGTAELTGANQTDFRILKENVEGAIFELEELKEAEWNPLVYNQSLANGLYVLIAREFATPEERIPNLRETDGRNSQHHRAGEGESETLAQDLHRDRDRADAGSDFIRPRWVSARCSIARRK